MGEIHQLCIKSSPGGQNDGHLGHQGAPPNQPTSLRSHASNNGGCEGNAAGALCQPGGVEGSSTAACLGPTSVPDPHAPRSADSLHRRALGATAAKPAGEKQLVSMCEQHV